MKTTIFKILRNEKDLVERALAEVGVPVTFFTMENSEGLLQCEIECTDPGLMFLFGKICGHAVATHQFENQ
jgi:hypothetical protein